MSAKGKAIEDIKKLGRFLKGIMDAADDLEKIASIEQATREAEARFADMAEKEKGMSEILANAQAKVDEAKEQAEVAIKAASAKAQMIIAKAENESAAVIASANAKLEEIMVLAKEKQDQANAELRGLKTDIAYAKAEIEEKGAALRELNEQLAAIRAKVV